MLKFAVFVPKIVQRNDITVIVIGLWNQYFEIINGCGFFGSNDDAGSGGDGIYKKRGRCAYGVSEFVSC